MITIANDDEIIKETIFTCFIGFILVFKALIYELI